MPLGKPALPRPLWGGSAVRGCGRLPGIEPCCGPPGYVTRGSGHCLPESVFSAVRGARATPSVQGRGEGSVGQPGFRPRTVPGA